MPTCPNCGEIIMEGDPYCSHCGTAFMWYHDDDGEEPPEKKEESPFLRLYNQMVASDMTTDERLDLFLKDTHRPDYLLDEIRESVKREEVLSESRFIMVWTDSYPEIYVFLRRGKFRDALIFNKCYPEYSTGYFDPENRDINYIYDRLYRDERFIWQVSEICKGGFEFCGVETRGISEWKDKLSARFTNGYIDVCYDIDDDLNMVKSLELLDVGRLYEYDGNCADKKRLLREIRRVENTDGVSFMAAGSATYLAFEGKSGIVIYDYEIASSHLFEAMRCSREDFREIYSARYSFHL